MSNWTIGKRLGVGFSAVIVVTCVLGGFAALRIVQLRDNAKAISGDALPGIIRIDKALIGNRTNDALLLRYITSADEAVRAEIEKELADNAKGIDAALKEYEGTITTAQDRALYEAIGPARDAMRAIRNDKVMPASKAHKSAEALAAYEKEYGPARDKYMAALQAEVEYNRGEGERYAKDIDDEVTASLWIVSIGLVFAVVLGAVVAWFVTRSTNGILRKSVTELSEGAQQTVSAAGQVATSSQSLSQGATEQAASLEETSASMEEMASMTRQNAENSQTAASLMGEVDNRVRESNGALGEMVTSMASIQESSLQVAKIIKTIDEIAFQTNILALNAAVEAARAGEAGMGFAVVADEVRNLAQRSAQAAKDTAGLIEASIVKAKAGNQKVEQVASAISGITESVSKVKSLVDEVSVASRQQTQGIDQVSQAISQMEKVTQTTAATAEESAAASEELNAQAEGAMSVVKRLEALVGGAAARATAHVAGARRGGNVVRIAAKTSVAKTPNAEEQLPLGDTGTYGRF